MGMVEHVESGIKERVIQKLERDLGATFLTALNDPNTVELMLNADGKVWHEKQGQRPQFLCRLRKGQGQAVIESVAGFFEKEITKNSPLLECEFPLDGSRFAGQLPPVVPCPTFTIRKKPHTIFTLEQYVESGILTTTQRDFLIQAVKEHKNILVIGGTGSGKTTFVNAVIDQMVKNDPLERIFIIEDTGEIQCSAENFVQYHTTLNVTMTMLLKTTLRMRPDRILVGEVRGEEALDLLDAWNTGHSGGVATLHANSAVEGLTRLKSLVTRNKFAPTDIETLIGQAVHVIVHIARTKGGRKIKEILEVFGYNENSYLTKQIEA